MKKRIKVAQQFLQKQGLYNGNIDGIPGPMTVSALNNVSELNPNWHTQQKLIGYLQLMAKENGINPGSIDGIWGPQTSSVFEQLDHLISFGKVMPAWRPDERISPNSNLWPIQNSGDFNGLFGERGEQNLTSIPSAYTMSIAWEPFSPVHTIRCHQKVADSVGRILQKVKEIYGEREIKRLGMNQFGGCFNNRKMRQGNNWSMHSWGIALDFDPANNPLKWGRDRATFARPEYDEWWHIWEEEGWLSLGRTMNFDWMHVQAARIF